MASVVRPFPALTLVLALLSSAVGCKAQGEGERCEKAKTQNADCEPPLVCIPANDLAESTMGSKTDRCCPSVSGEETDSRCTRKAPGTGNSGGTSGTGGTSNTSGTGGTSGGTGGTDGASEGGVGGESGGGGVPSTDGGMSGGGDTSAAGAGAVSSMAGQGGAP
jgi:hypothetical protein